MEVHKMATPSKLQIKFPMKARAPFESLLKSYSSEDVEEFVGRVYFLTSFTAFAELGYDPISLLL